MSWLEDLPIASDGSRSHKSEPTTRIRNGTTNHEPSLRLMELNWPETRVTEWIRSLDTGAVFPLLTAYHPLNNHSTPAGVFGNPLFHFYLPREYSQSVLWESWPIYGILHTFTNLCKDLDTKPILPMETRLGRMSMVSLVHAPSLNDTVV